MTVLDRAVVAVLGVLDKGMAVMAGRKCCLTTFPHSNVLMFAVKQRTRLSYNLPCTVTS